MKQDIQAIYENGVLHPLQPLTLAENEQVAITVHSGDEQWIDTDAHDWATKEGDTSLPLEMVREHLAKIRGSLAER